MKTLQDGAKVINSLRNLREELERRDQVSANEMIMKINSCLFSEYPHKSQHKE